MVFYNSIRDIQIEIVKCILKVILEGILEKYYQCNLYSIDENNEKFWHRYFHNIVYSILFYLCFVSVFHINRTK